VASWVGHRFCLGGTYIIGSVDPKLLEGGMASHFLGSEGCESGDERRLHDGYDANLWFQMRGVLPGSSEDKTKA
jgi:hypothetical protein